MSEELESIATKIKQARKSLPPKYRKALPKPTRITAPFFEATKKHELMLQQCNNCRVFQWYPRPSCIECGCRDMTWMKSSGRGEVYSYTYVRQVVSNPGWESDIPYLLAIVELKEGVRIEAPIIGVKPEEMRIGLAVQVSFRDVSEDFSIYEFGPVAPPNEGTTK